MATFLVEKGRYLACPASRGLGQAEEKLCFLAPHDLSQAVND
jgi:hypothetical protein